MPRRVQDIVPGDRRSIRNIPLRDMDSEHKESKRHSSTKTTTKGEISINRVESVSPKRMPIMPPSLHAKKQDGRSGKKWIGITLVIVIVIVIAGYLASTFFARATFTITPKIIPVSVSGTYVAKSSPTDAGLFYELVTIKGVASTTVPASDGPQISTKAQGKIVLYNSSSAQSVRLIAGTRLSDETGRIYRLTSSVVIPGYKGSGNNITPGTLVANIIADQAGNSYNATKVDLVAGFKIVAYKGSTKYDTIYAKASTDISGGFVGVKKTINPSIVASTTASLKANLSASLATQVKSSIPAGYIMYDKGYTLFFSSANVSGTDSNRAVISVTGSMYGFLFKKDNLVSRLAGEEAVASFGGLSYVTDGLESLNFNITNLKDFSPDKKLGLVIQAKGNLKLVGDIPIEEIKNKLAGVSLSETQNIFKSYASIIESGSGELIPPWAKIPKDLERISVIVKGE